MRLWRVLLDRRVILGEHERGRGRDEGRDEDDGGDHGGSKHIGDGDCGRWR